MSDAFRIHLYSPDNQYADEYYKAIYKFRDAEKKLKKIDKNSSGTKKAKNIMKEYQHWKKEVPQTYKLAQNEEQKVKEEEKNQILGKRLDMYC